MTTHVVTACLHGHYMMIMSILLIPILDAPEIISTNSSTHIVTLGQELRLHCGYAGVPAPTIQWFLNSTELTSESREFNGSVIDGGNFTYVEINSLSHGNEGTYMCRATNSLGSDVGSYTVTLSMLFVSSKLKSFHTWNVPSLSLKGGLC